MSAPPASRDLREGGAWTWPQRVKNDLILGLVRAAIALTIPLPPAVLRRVGRAVGECAWLVLGAARRTARTNLARALPSMSPAAREALLRAAYRRLGGHLGDAVAQLSPRRPIAALPFAEGARDVLAAARAEGRGVLFASAHLGPWERVAASLVASGVPLVTLAREPYDPRLAVLFERLRGARGVRTIYRGGHGAASRIVRALHANDVLGCPMDLRSRVPSIGVPFLGWPAPTPVGPARIALRTGAAVVVGTVAPSADGQGALAITCTRIPSADLAPDAAGEIELTTRINDELSRRIRALPAEWVWMHERFPPDAPR